MSSSSTRIRYSTKAALLHYYNIDDIDSPKDYMEQIKLELGNIDDVLRNAIGKLSVKDLGLEWEEDKRYRYVLKPLLAVKIPKRFNRLRLFIDPSEFNPKVPLMNSKYEQMAIIRHEFEADSVVVEVKENIADNDILYYGPRTISWERVKSEDIIKRIKQATKISTVTGDELKLVDIREKTDHYIVFFDSSQELRLQSNEIIVDRKRINVELLKPPKDIYEIRIRNRSIEILKKEIKGRKIFIDARIRIKDRIVADSKGYLYKCSLLHSKEDACRGVWIVLKEPREEELEGKSKIDLFFELINSALEEEVLEEPDADPRNKELRIKVLRKDYEENRLCLERLPGSKRIYPPKNDYQLRMQRKAIKVLMYSPFPEHRGLLRLFEDRERAVFPSFSDKYKEEDIEWLILTDPNYEGTDKQREFVVKALNTPDFMFLEGPPGSGKTTAISELIYQLLRRGKRVLLVASTHVAVDNVIEKLEEYFRDKEGLMANGIVPLRIGREEVVSEDIRKYHIDRRKEKMYKILEDENWFRQLPDEEKERVVENLVMMSSNLVCGTTIGILQYPSFKRAYIEKRYPFPEFDYMIIDEASKTTLPEFLVPAIYAKRWIVIGDIKQLSPYVDILPLRVNLSSVIKDYALKRALQIYLQLIFHRRGTKGFRPPNFIYIDRLNVVRKLAEIIPKKIYEKHRDNKYKLKIAFVVPSENRKEFQKIGNVKNEYVMINIFDENDFKRGGVTLGKLLDTDIIFAVKKIFNQYYRYFPVSHILVHHGGSLEKHPHNFRHLYWFRWFVERRGREPYKLRIGRQILDDFMAIQDELAEALMKDWGHELAWRFKRLEELRLVKEEERSKGYYTASFYALLPPRNENPRIDGKIKIIGQVFMTSVITCFYDGMSPDWHIKRVKTSISHGMPNDAKKDRFLRLAYQHRMHPDISLIPRKLFYNEEALRDGSNVKGEGRQWSYGRYKYRVVWFNVHGRTEKNRNEAEARILLRELEKFVSWAVKQEKKFQVMILSFYENQRKLIRDLLREKYPENRRKQTRFKIKGIDVRVYTVDKAQGREADIVFLSMVRNKRVGFLDSPNRLNVALTRARYQLVIIGNHDFFKTQKHSYILWRVAEEIEKNFEVINEGEKFGRI